MKTSQGRAALLAAAVVCAALGGPPARATGGVALPFNTLLSQVAGWMTGQAAVWIGTIALAAAAFVWMFLRHARSRLCLPSAPRHFDRDRCREHHLGSRGHGGARLRSEVASERLAQHWLPQSTLFVPLFAGVEAPILGFEVMAILVAAHVTGLRWLAIGLVGAVLLGVHLALAAATRRDRRLTLVVSRSLRYPRYARPWPTKGARSRAAEPTFPRRLLA